MKMLREFSSGLSLGTRCQETSSALHTLSDLILTVTRRQRFYEEPFSQIRTLRLADEW